MKKYIMSLIVLFVICSAQAMDLELINNLEKRCPESLKYKCTTGMEDYIKNKEKLIVNGEYLSLNYGHGKIWIPKQEYVLNDKNSKEISHLQKMLLVFIVYASNAWREPNVQENRFQLTNEDVELIKPIKDLLVKANIFNDVFITTDIAVPTESEKRMNSFLFVAPLLFNTIIPDILYSATTRLSLPLVAGGIAAGGLSYMVGQYGVPAMDFRNSNARNVREWFGEDNCKVIKKGTLFVILSIMQYFATGVGRKLFDCVGVPWQVLGVAIHIFRILIPFISFGSMDNVYRFVPENNIDYDKPFIERSNACGNPFSFFDLLNGPKFS